MALTKININRMVKEALPTVNGGTGSTSGVDLSNIDYNNLQNKPTIPTTTSQLTNNSGFLNSAPAPTTAQVLSATAGLSAGAVGSYGFMFTNGTSTLLTAGVTRAGSLLFFSTAHTYNSGGGSGTWRCLGASMRSSDSSNYGSKTTLWLRIS